MEKTEQKDKMLWGVLFLFLQAGGTALCRFLLGESMTDMIRCVLWITLFGGIVLAYWMLTEKHFRQQNFHLLVFFVSMVPALPCALFYTHTKPLAAFYIGMLLVSALVDQGMGIMSVFYLCGAAVLKDPGGVEEAASLLALGIVLCLLAVFLKRNKNLAETFLLSGMVTAILYLLRTSLHGSKVSYRELGLELFSTAAVLACAGALIRLYMRLVPKEDAVSHIVLAQHGDNGLAAAEPQGMDVSGETGHVQDLTDAYKALLAPDAWLMVRMKHEAEPLYLASMRLASIAGAAASQVAADAARCKVIAQYLDVCRLADGHRCLQGGIELMREAGMPEEIIGDITVISQKDVKPATKETAVVLLASTVMKTWNFPKTHEIGLTQDKVIDKVFTVMLNKGALDESGLTVKDYGSLKKCMLKEFTFQP